MAGRQHLGFCNLYDNTPYKKRVPGYPEQPQLLSLGMKKCVEKLHYLTFWFQTDKVFGNLWYVPKLYVDVKAIW